MKKRFRQAIINASIVLGFVAMVLFLVAVLTSPIWLSIISNNGEVPIWIKAPFS